MNEILNIIKELKDLSVKKTLILLLSAIILLAVYKFDTVIDSTIKIQNHIFKNPQEVIHSPIKDKPKIIVDIEQDFGVSEQNLEYLKQYVLEYLNRYPQNVYSVQVFKFLPQGSMYSYQGRALIVFKSKQLQDKDEAKLLKELNISWIPMWSGKNQMEQILQQIPVVLKYDENINQFISNDNNHDFAPSANFQLLHELGVKTIFRYPIIQNNNVVGYLQVYLTEVIDEKTEIDLKRISLFLSNRIVNYLTEEK